ncbi:hypothetical protein G7054_g9651 [Neopestalotiopsis clavispora]|nr:hypothetical protein G7054_g9651 [Neopestalotiopsis clavispora]
MSVEDEKAYSEIKWELAKEESKKRLSLRIRGPSDLFLHEKTNGRDLEIWHKMVEKYSVLELTRMSDRLPALSGLAERIAPGSRPYLAGLWKDTIRLDLLWRVDQINESHRRTPENLSPTWSWSSVSSGVKYWTREELKENIFYRPLDVRDVQRCLEISTYRQQLDRLVSAAESQGSAPRPFDLPDRPNLDRLSPEMLDWCLLKRSCTSIPSISHTMLQIGENPFGEVEKGILEMKGYVKQATLKYVKVPSDKRYHDWDNDPLQYQLDFTSSVQPHFHADYNLSEPHPEHQVPDKEIVYLLEVLVNLFLVLRRNENGDYQRIGIFRAQLTLNQSYGIDLMMLGKIQDVRLV